MEHVNIREIGVKNGKEQKVKEIVLGSLKLDTSAIKIWS